MNFYWMQFCPNAKSNSINIWAARFSNKLACCEDSCETQSKHLKIIIMKKIIATALIILVFSKTYGQNNSLINSNLQDRPIMNEAFPVIMPAGSQYTASNWKALWWGNHLPERMGYAGCFPGFELVNV